MHRSSSFVAVWVAVVMGGAASPSPAQPAVLAPVSPDSIDCRQLAASAAPMTVEACEAQVAAMRNLQQSMNQPGGERPGDELLSCDQIVAEMKQTVVTPLRRENVEEGVAAGRQVREVQQRQAAEAAAMSITQAGRTAAAGAAPNAVQGAVVQSNLAEQQAMSARATGEMGPAMARLNAANAATQNDLARMMRSNPRMARLTQLAVKKNCTYAEQ